MRPGGSVGIAGLGYTGVFTLLSWQAWRGQALMHPDRLTLMAFAVVAVFTLLTAAAVIITARSARPEPPKIALTGEIPAVPRKTHR